jgi:hypothetical protein
MFINFIKRSLVKYVLLIVFLASLITGNILSAAIALATSR